MLVDCWWGGLLCISVENMVSYSNFYSGSSQNEGPGLARHFSWKAWLSSPSCTPPPCFLDLTTVSSNYPILQPYTLLPKTCVLFQSYQALCAWMNVDPRYLGEFIWHPLSSTLKFFLVPTIAFDALL